MTFPTYTEQVIKEGHEFVRTFNAAEDVTQGQLVKLDAAAGRGVEPSDADGEACIGFATQTRSSGEEVPVATEGAVVRAVAAASVNSGDYLASDGNTSDEGEVEPAVSGDHVIGIALSDSTGTGSEATIEVLVSNSIYGNP